MKVSLDLYRDYQRENVVHVVIDERDTWNLDYTLALIIHPALVALKERKHGAPWVDNADVPEEFHCIKETEWESASQPNWFKRWDYVLDEMIFAFDFKSRQDIGGGWYAETDKEVNARIHNGLRLFSKYYNTLWS